VIVFCTQGSLASNLTLKLNIHLFSTRSYVAISSSLRHKQVAGAPNDGFLLNHALKTLFRLSRVLLDLKKCILRSAIEFVSIRSS